jgi:hypothetical protein
MVKMTSLVIAESEVTNTLRKSLFTSHGNGMTSDGQNSVVELYKYFILEEKI